ncbi:unnamed protein product, partial [Heterotrigona itama]
RSASATRRRERNKRDDGTSPLRSLGFTQLSLEITRKVPEEWRTETENERMLEEQRRTELEVFEKVCNFLEEEVWECSHPGKRAHVIG